MDFIREEVSKLQETAIFDALPSLALTQSSENDLRQRRRGGPVSVGGGGIQGPSVEDAVDVEKLLAEMRAAPPSRTSS